MTSCCLRKLIPEFVYACRPKGVKCMLPVQILKLLQEATPEMAEVSMLTDALKQLDELFLLVVVGEFNSGKSSVINALLGSRYDNVLPSEGLSAVSRTCTMFTLVFTLHLASVEPGKANLACCLQLILLISMQCTTSERLHTTACRCDS